MASGSCIGVVGATGAVGREVLGLLCERGIPAGRVRAVASGRSAGAIVRYGDVDLVVEGPSTDAWSVCDAFVFASSAEVSRARALSLAATGRWVVDNSSAFRMDPGVPLVVPEINGDELPDRPGLVANPNCSTVMLLMALVPVARLGEVRHVSVSTYQAVSGAGLAAIEELECQTAAVLAGRAVAPGVFPVSCAFNVFPHESAVDPVDGSCGEEQKIVRESRRILGRPSLGIFATCARVPVVRAHSQSVVIEFAEAPSVEQVREALLAAPGVELRCSGPVTPLEASGRDAVLVGRVRVDAASGRVGLWACMDQLRKGAALNAVQILERVGVLPAGLSVPVPRGSTGVVGSAV